MAGALNQTGLPGVPAAPFVVSFGAASPLDEGGTDLDVKAVARAAFDVVDRIKREHRAQGWLKWDEWLLMVDGPDIPIRNVRYESGDVDRAALDGFLDRLDHDLDRVQLSSGRWGELTIGQPEIRFRTAEVASVSASIRCPVDEAVAPTFGSLRSLLVEHHGQTGFVHVDSIADPYTEIMCQSQASSNDFEHQVHGYYAAVFLGPGQVGELGGQSRVRDEAPCATVEPVGDGLLCQLVDSPLELTAEAVRRWRNFLAPVLRRGFPESRDMVGVPLTPLARPTWLFEGPPVDAGLRMGLMEGYVPADADVPEPVLAPDLGTGAMTIGMDLPPDSDPGLSELVAATVRAWVVAGQAGRLHRTGGRLASVAQRPSAGGHSIEFDVDPGDLSADEIADSLAVALASLRQPIGAVTIG